MRRWLVVAVACVALAAGFARGADVEAAKQAVDKALRAADGAFSPALRQAYIDYVEAVTRAKYGPAKINERTWKWLRQHPEVLSAAAAAEWPANPNVLLNFQRLALALGPQQADRWSQLALAYAIRYRQEPIAIDRAKEAWNPARLERAVSSNEKGKGGDFGLLDEDDFPEVSDEERRLGEWLAGPQSLSSTRPPLTIPELMEMPLHEINMMTRRTPDDPPMLTKFPNWENVALGGRIYPPYVDGTPTPQRACLLKIWRNGRIPRRTEGRPDFDMADAEWPILLYLADLAQIDETSFFFYQVVKHKAIPAPGGGQSLVIGDGANVNTRSPAFRFARSNWHPDKFIRVYNGSKKDQGGRSWAWALNAVNVPATVVSAPPDGKFWFTGGKGNYHYFMQCADNAHTGTGSKAPWHLERPLAAAGPVEPGQVQHRWFMGLAATLNQGLRAYEDARIARAVIDLLRLSQPRRVALLESVFLMNPLDGDVFNALAAEYRQAKDATGTLRLLTAARAYAAHGLKRPVNQAAVRAGRSAAAKAWKLPEPSYQGLPDVPEATSPWFFLLCSDAASQFLRDAGGKDKARFRDELAYEQRMAQGVGDKPIVRALETLQSLTR